MQRTVVIQNCVHVLNPQRVDGAIEEHPVEVVGLVVDGEAHERGDQSVGPLLRCLVHLTVELSHGHRLGIELVDLDALVLGALVAIALELREACSERLRADRLTREGEADHPGLAAPAKREARICGLLEAVSASDGRRMLGRS